ncbi:MAG: class I SAM-dependent methyltransferase [Planctomycetes bacterium]|nr:class I SAM-dependent methyltransferase [Planctomycetota bacterium]
MAPNSKSVKGDRFSLYERLARHEWMRRRLTRARHGERLELHKALLAPQISDAPSAGKTGLHTWLWSRFGLRDVERVLDVGCGFGATILAWARQPGAGDVRFTGIGCSAFQIRRASEQAERVGVADRCEFRRQEYSDPIAGEFDCIVSIEALLHADDLDTTLAGLAAVLEPGGRLVCVEDMLLGEFAADADVRALATAWHTPRIHSREDWARATEAAGLLLESEVDLSAQVPVRSTVDQGRQTRRLRRIRRLLAVPYFTSVIDAFQGGLALERLYARGIMRYVAAKWVKSEARK